MIEGLKAYLEKEQVNDPTIEEKYFISLLLDQIIDKIKDSLKRFPHKIMDEKTQYNPLSEKSDPLVRTYLKKHDRNSGHFGITKI